MGSLTIVLYARFVSIVLYARFVSIVLYARFVILISKVNGSFVNSSG